jgi:SAM-dependent methyltransferase
MAAGTTLVDENTLIDVEAYVAGQAWENEQFWARLGHKPDLTGQAVLDFGCGHGMLSLACAQLGARSVLGIDLSEQRIAYANARTKPQSKAVLSFEKRDLRTLPEDPVFDAVVSKNSMEHVTPLRPTVEAMVRRLKPGGRLILGFSPLWWSPFGDHGEAESKWPWAHVWQGEAKVLAKFNARNKTSCASLPEAGYNMLTPAQYRAAFAGLGLRQDSLRVNPSEGGLKGLMMAGMNLARRVPGLEPYFTAGLYGIWTKTA